MTSVEKLYELCEIIDNSSGPEAEKDFLQILSGTKGGTNEKRLASQLIVRYFSKFPSCQNRALDAIFELCEDDDVNIRKSVIRELPILCKQQGSHVVKIADVLVQLLQSDDLQEQHIVQQALSVLLEAHAKDTVSTLFDHILSAEEELLRERAVKFLTAKLPYLSPAILTHDLEMQIIDESKKVLQDVTGEEFVSFMSLLSLLPLLQTVTGRQQLLDMVVDQADLDKPFDASDGDRVDRVLQCGKQALPFLSKNVHCTPFITYLLDKVLPVIEQVESAEGQLEILRLTAEMAPFCGDIDNFEERMNVVVKCLMSFLPLSPSESEDGGGENSTSSQQDPENSEVRFSELEALVWILHQMGKKHVQFLGAAERADLLKELRKRFQYLARLIQVFSKKLRDLLAGKSKEELKKDENKIKVMALRTTFNLQVLLKDLLHCPPSYKSTIYPSWKPPEQKDATGVKRPSAGNGATAPTVAAKRPAPDRKTREVYQPPEGKFSVKVGKFHNPAVEQWRGGRGGGRPFRGRGGRRWQRW